MTASKEYRTNSGRKMEMFRPCDKTFCKEHAEYSKKLSRYKGLCLHQGNCLLMDIAQSANVINVLDVPISQARQNMQKLTDEELDFCINTETRKTALKELKNYKKYRQESRTARCR